MFSNRLLLIAHFNHLYVIGWLAYIDVNLGEAENDGKVLVNEEFNRSLPEPTGLN